MGETMTIKTHEIPADIAAQISDLIGLCSVGFLSLSADGEPHLRGSGTLVSANGKRGIVTAEHVVRNLPKEGKLSLVTPSGPLYKLNASDLQCAWLDRGINDEDGPDIALLVGPVLASIAAQRTFYNLDFPQGQLHLVEYEKDGFWIMSGFVDELTKITRNGIYSHKSFNMISGVGQPFPAFLKEGYDYIDNKISCDIVGLPVSFGGISGGGLWHAMLLNTGETNEKGERIIGVSRPIFSGVAFYQFGESDPRRVRCHFRKTIYEAVHRKLGELGS